MSFVAECFYCHHQVQAPDGSAGLSATCPRCHNCFTLAPAAKAAAGFRKPRTRKAKKPDPVALPATAVAPETPRPPVEAFVPGPSPLFPAVSITPEATAPAAGRWKVEPFGGVALMLCGLGLLLNGVAVWFAALSFLKYLTIPLSLVGVILGVIGWLQNAEEKPSRWAWSVAGGSVNLLVLAMAWLWPGLLGWDGGSGSAAEARRKAAEPVPIPLSGSLAKPRAVGGPITSSEGEWVDASKALVQKSGVRVQVSSAAVSPVPFKQGTKQKATPKPCLIIRLKISNVGAEGNVAYRGWGVPGQDAESHAATLRDGSGKTYARPALGPGVEVVGQVTEATVFPARSVEDVLVFEAPPGTADFVYLELPAAACGGSGSYKFAIPKSMLALAP
jgi:hypothetical protein